MSATLQCVLLEDAVRTSASASASIQRLKFSALYREAGVYGQKQILKRWRELFLITRFFLFSSISLFRLLDGCQKIHHRGQQHSLGMNLTYIVSCHLLPGFRGLKMTMSLLSKVLLLIKFTMDNGKENFYKSCDIICSFWENTRIS
jgi:multisubunit Na+/H+ antiporter MnhG subunit